MSMLRKNVNANDSTTNQILNIKVGSKFSKFQNSPKISTSQVMRKSFNPALIRSTNNSVQNPHQKISNYIVFQDSNNHTGKDKGGEFEQYRRQSRIMNPPEL